MLKKFYILLACAMIGLFGVASAAGWEFGNDPPETLPADMRHGGYRSFHFSHSGFRGGK